MTDSPDTFLKRLAGEERGLLKISKILRIAGAVLTIAQAGLLALIVDHLVMRGASLGAQAPYLGALVAVILLRFAAALMAERLAIKASASIGKRLRSDLYSAIQVRGPHWIGTQGSGALLESLSGGVDALGPYYSEYMPAKAMMTVIPLMILCVVFPLDWVSGLDLLLSAPLIPVFMILIGKGTEAQNKKQWRQLALMGNHFLDSIQGLRTIKLFGAARRTGEAVSDVAERYRTETMKVLRIAFLSSTVLEFIATLGIALVAVFIGFRLLWGDISFLPGFFILMLAPEFYLPLRKMGAAYHARMEAIGAAEKIQTILEEHERKSSDLAIEDDVPTAKRSVANESLSVAPIQLNVPPKIGLRNVSYKYKEGRKALENISLEAKPGAHIALVGPSGAGKSSILSLLLGFMAPDSGEILVDGQETDMKALRGYVCWVPQQPTLFYGSVLNNVRLGRQSASEEEVVQICRRLGLHDFISRMPEGYQTLLGEGGYGLSGGQIRRMAIARAMLRDAPLVLLDEPTASLDHETENIITAALDDLTKGKTVVTIAHRLQTVRHADQIYFMEGGYITHQGTHAQLLETCPAYAALVHENLSEEAA